MHYQDLIVFFDTNAVSGIQISHDFFIRTCGMLFELTKHYMKRVSCLFLSIVLSAISAQAQTVHYVNLGAREMSIDSYNSHSQKILSILEKSDSLKLVRIATFNEWEDSLALSHFSNDPYIPDMDYPDSIRQYLQPTRMINSDSETTRHIAEKIYDGKEQTIFQVLDKALRFSSLLKYDEELASKIGNGELLGKSSDSSVESWSGTCGEAANVFIALMRYMKVPARFVTGYVWNEAENVCSGHAWAEVYFDSFGWWAVNPQTSGTAIPYYAYKILVGTDIEHLGINKLSDMYINESRWLIIKESEEDN